ncbi:disulfide isomerase DsbC N-terminal domain-containing protein [Psychrobacter sp. JB385]|uniref:disulfide isomerase DsbC N-terminal domain-containing protein n=1 Tax=Psychrobacter sp. JB385 TaxID=1434841 RepID=UPI00097F6013|nr:disulfide isomerase DsbC N-terminal domain-containing protein [Psychrobacter sp. JB385]SJN42256.1 Thiol:disulfide interchange protein DsbC [Psychrobacter sp. JB385]
MKRSLLISTTLIGTFIVATTACAQPTPKEATSQNISQNTINSQATGTMSQAIDSHLRQVLTQAGIKTQITSIAPSNLPNMYQVNLAGQAPLHITKDGKYVIQGELQKNPSKRVVTKTLPRSHSEQIGQPVSTAVKSAMLANMSALKNMSTKTPFFYTAVPGVIWGATLEGVPFLLSDDAQYITDGEISVIENGQFVGLDTAFEQRKNQSVLATLDNKQLIRYPATSTEKAVIYVADDVNCPYCRRFHQQIPMLNAKGVTVNVIGYPIYEQSPAQMRGIWCQGSESSRRQAFDKAMLQGEINPASASCNVDHVTPNRDKAAGLAVIATPAIYREDGVLYQASFESPEFLEFLGIE